MHSKSKLLGKAELDAYEASRDLAADVLQSIREMKASHVHVVASPVIEARKKTGLSQSEFATSLGLSVRALQGWEQGRKQPSGAVAAGHRKHEPEGAAGGCRQIAGGNEAL